MTAKLTAVVLGGSGSVGEALLRALFSDDEFCSVVILSRRLQPELAALVSSERKTLVQKIVPEMTPAELATATKEAVLETGADLVEAFSVLGIGANTAKLTIDEHRAVDVALNEAFARGLRESGRVPHLAFMSAVGANPLAKETGSGAAGMSRYNRVKGESEEAVRKAGPSVVSIFRPSMILGSRHTPGYLEKTLPLLSRLTPAQFRAITTEQIAKAMIATAKKHPQRSEIYHYSEMLKLGSEGRA